MAHKLLLFIKEFGLVAEGVVPRSKKRTGRDGLSFFYVLRRRVNE